MKKSSYSTETVELFLKNVQCIYGLKVYYSVVDIVNNMGLDDEFIPSDIIEEVLKKNPEERQKSLLNN